MNDAYRVCIAEDEPLTREGLLALPWSEVGAVVAASAKTGSEAVDILQSEDIDVVLADIRMPEMNGLELAAHVCDNFPSVRVVLLSGYGEFEYAQEALKYGVESYLLKPAEPSDVLEAVRQAAATARQTRAHDLRIRRMEEELGKQRLQRIEGQLVLGRTSHSDVARQAIRYVLDNYKQDISLQTMSDRLHFSSIYLSRVIKRATDYTFTEILAALRMLDAARLLRETTCLVSSVGEQVGYPDARYFSQVFKRFYGAPPSAYRARPVAPVDDALVLLAVSLKEAALEET